MEEGAEKDLEKKEELYFVTHITHLRHNTGTEYNEDDFILVL